MGRKKSPNRSTEQSSNVVAEPLKEPCSACGGNGIVPHLKRRQENGEVDPSDLQTLDVCTRCGGGGKVTLDKARVVEKGAGYIADHI